MAAKLRPRGTLPRHVTSKAARMAEAAAVSFGGWLGGELGAPSSGPESIEMQLGKRDSTLTRDGVEQVDVPVLLIDRGVA